MITLLGLAHLNECDGYTCIERLTPASQRASARITCAANKSLGAKYTSRHFTRTGVINEIEITMNYTLRSTRRPRAETFCHVHKKSTLVRP